MSRQRGQAMVLFVVFLPVVLGMVALAIDLSLLGDAHLRLQSVAAEAAAAGADQSRFEGGRTTVDQLAARAAAERTISAAALVLDPPPTIVTTPTSVTVELAQTYRPSFLQALGVRSFPLRARVTKEPRSSL